MDKPGQVEKSTYEQIVVHFEKELELNGFFALDKIQVKIVN